MAPTEIASRNGCIVLMLLSGSLLAISCSRSAPENRTLFPPELVRFSAYDDNPVFTGTDTSAWDNVIRERGYILREEDGYHMWYCGYNKQVDDGTIYLGYATSPDGLQWTRYAGNPIFKGSWTEDMMVLKHDSLYYMFAEGRNDIAHMLTSPDKVSWTDHGSLQIRMQDGSSIGPGPYGTPTVMIKDDLWYLFYERNDSAIWLASSPDAKVWTNVQDNPVLEKGPEPYDRYGVAVNQVMEYKGRYYAWYHGTAFPDWHEWSTNVAVSENLVDWTKYPGNPVMKENKSSGILVDDGMQYRLYTMHPAVCVHWPADSAARQP